MFTISLAITQDAYAASIAVNIQSNSSVPGCEQTNSCYTPAGTLLLGDSVTWINKDSTAHTITSGTPSKDPDRLFDSGLFTTGESFSYQFTSIGRYDYFCAVHPWMTGYVRVGLPENVTIIDGATCYGTQLDFDKSSYTTGSNFIIIVDSKNANINPNVVDTVQVSVTSNSTSQTVIVYETGADTGIFTFSSSVDKFVTGTSILTAEVLDICNETRVSSSIPVEDTTQFTDLIPLILSSQSSNQALC